MRVERRHRDITPALTAYALALGPPTPTPEDDVDVIVAARWIPGHTYTRGSSHDRLCDLCGRLVVLAPVTRRLLTGSVLLWCAQCAHPRMRWPTGSGS